MEEEVQNKLSPTHKAYERVMTLKKKHGKCGKYIYNDGTLYIGDFDEQGIKSGIGHLEIGNGAIYDGQFEKGLPNGVGIMFFPDKSEYIGEFMQGWFHGHGIYTTHEGMKFEGEFRGGRIWGFGMITYKRGETGTSGYFQDSKYSREGDADENVKSARQIVAYAKRICQENGYVITAD
ncbi:MORN repeat-containing protein 4 homolog [Lepeophtheirus salmonis]|uniref:MORN repeat-containing protein 4 homolog n=1 Tax=Lepeophtheirus salmonis TaxID=72036 RepID=A0A7R8CIU5_LEPSM|nr:MORN repeat-containing protein 4 homolog [Lepeophtheirus salmonis]CAB4058615.1 MORN repeat-containing protein 4 homolog [Lepeophtheirus salmonis]CAF2836468.1 MORN repeat-containing protein 4 homolog [Lepeophtheirus salmonis]